MLRRTMPAMGSHLARRVALVFLLWSLLAGMAPVATAAPAAVPEQLSPAPAAAAPRAASPLHTQFHTPKGVAATTFADVARAGQARMRLTSRQVAQPLAPATRAGRTRVPSAMSVLQQAL